MGLNQWYEKGMTPDTYIDSMETHKENLLHIYNNFKVPADDHLFAEMKSKNLRAIVLTEDWCGDAMLNVPILLRFAENANINVRMLLRDQNLELMDQYLTNGKSRSIPIFIFIDEDGNEIAKWGPRAPKIQQVVDEARASLPDKESDDYQTKWKEMISSMNQSFKENTEFWNYVYDSITEQLR